MTNWNWTNPDETWFTGVVFLSELDEEKGLKHFYYGLDKTTCGLKVERFKPSDDALVTCPDCRNRPSFFEYESDKELETVSDLLKQ